MALLRARRGPRRRCVVHIETGPYRTTEIRRMRRQKASKLPGSRPRPAKVSVQRGAYTDAQLDAAILRSQRSDPISVGIRLATIGVVYFLLGRAVAEGMGAIFLLLPLLAELLAMFWLGVLMAFSLVRCPSFRASMGSGVGIVLWSLGICGAVAAWMAHDTASGTWSLAALPQGARRTWDMGLGFGVHWAILIAVLGLAVASLREALAWRPEEGAFVWTAITSISVRLGLALLLGFFAFIGFVFLQPVVGPLLNAAVEGGSGAAWTVWAALLLIDVGVVVVLALMHRELLAKQAASQRVRP